MTLTAPNISLPLSVWTKTLQVTGAVSGATVFVRSIGPNPRDIATSSPVAGGSDWLALLPGVSLQADDLLVAKQVRQADGSDWTPKSSAYPVNDPGSDPTKLSAVTLDTFPWECGEHVQVSGAEAGATIEVFLGATPIGSAVAPLGWARFALTNKLVAPGPIRFRQNTPIGPGPMTDLEVAVLPFPLTTPFPPPQVEGVLHGCEDLVSMKGVYDGATVILDLSTGESYSFGASISTPTLHLPGPLKWNSANPQTVTLKQTMPHCRRDGAPGPPVTVGAPDAGSPSVWGLCKGSPQTITVADLNAKSLVLVRVFVDGAEFRVFSVHGKSLHSFAVDPPLDAGDVYAIQELCGQPSPPSATVKVEEHPPITLQPTLRAPLYSCARSVRVKDVNVGAEVRLFAKSPSTGIVNELQRKVFLSPVDDFDVAPVLKQDDEIWVVAIGCGSTLESPHETVKPHPAIQAPKIREPVENEDTSVVVVGLIPTATVYVYVREKDRNWELAGVKNSADGSLEYISLNRVLKTGQEVAAAQYYCQVASGRGPSVTVVKKRPVAPKLLSPSEGQKNVATSTTFTWSDPGASTDRKADTFDIFIFQGSFPIDSANGLTATSYTIAAGKLKIGSSSSWRVQGRNSSGVGDSSQATFTTLAPTPVLTAYDQQTFHLKGMNFPPGMDFTLHYRYEVDMDLYFGDQKFITDGRQGTVTGSWAADPAGNLDVIVDLYTKTPTLPFTVQNPGGGVFAAIKGPLKGSNVVLWVEYHTPSLGWIQSAPLKFAWTKDTVLA